ncbi:MAG: cytidyltransferase [Verrucomicrobia bacterium]|nr:cytidyltransferase [Verrucomicrobiota bacterium]
MSQPPKVVPFAQLGNRVSAVRRLGKRIVHCHGTFDLIHPGHLFHFEEAKAKGDFLVVTVTAGRFVKKGPGRPFFDDSLRAKSLAALSAVDLVSVVPYPAAKEAIEAVRPHIYCKGTEYRDRLGDVTGKLPEDIATVRKVGGKMAYVGSVVFSSSRLLQAQFDHRSPGLQEFCRRISRHTPAQALRRAVEEFSDLRVLVVGDVIFDRYSTVSIQGLTSKNRIIAGRFLGEETQPGGALAVYRHLCVFAPATRLVAAVGREPWVEPLLRTSLVPAGDRIIRDRNYVSILKQRFVEPVSEGKEVTKLFAVNYLQEGDLPEKMEREVLRRLRAEVPAADVVLVMDFGHGLLTPRVREYLQKRARLLVVNCQTNSNNFAFNLINRRYRRADAFALDSTEIHLAAGNKKISYEKELSSLARTLRSRYGWLTRGSVETLGWSRQGAFVNCEPLAKVVVDTVGAGDAFISLAALGVARKLPLDVITLLGQLAGAEAVGIIGNQKPVSKAGILKGALSLLS